MVIIIACVWILILKSQKFGTFEEKYYAFADSKYEVLAQRIDRFKHRNDKNIVHHKKKHKK